MSDRRISIFVDGHNVFHSLKNDYHQYLWLNYRRLAELFLGKKDQIMAVYYFTALAFWKPSGLPRHKDYIKALESVKITPVYGKFKLTSEFCKKCHKPYKGHEEKQTDVNIALKLMRGAVEDKYDVAILVTADSDLIPAVREVKDMFPAKKEIWLLRPIGRPAKDYNPFVDKPPMRITERHLQDAQFPDEVQLVDGSIVKRPAKRR